MKTPGVTAMHAIVTDTCRANRGDEGAIDEALARLRRSALSCLGAGKPGTRFHFVLSVERPTPPEEQRHAG